MVKLYDPSHAVSAEMLAALEGDLIKVVRSSMRKLLQTASAPKKFTVVSRSTYSKFGSGTESAFGVTALAECFAIGSVARLRFDDFDMVLIQSATLSLRIFRPDTRIASVSSSSNCSKALRCSSRRFQEREQFN